MSPGGALSWQATCSGKTEASRSSDRMRWRGGGTRFPPENRSRASAREASHRQRTPNKGDCSTACVSTFVTFAWGTNLKVSPRGKERDGPSERLIPSSVAAACSSKSKVRQISFLSAIPQALLIRDPNGEWTMSCIPPDSSKKRSATTRLLVGTVPRMRTPSSIYATACSAAFLDAPVSRTSHSTPWPPSSRSYSSSRSSEISSDSSVVRPAASPSQKGRVGEAPPASSTRTFPLSTRLILHGVLPSRNTSPLMLSMAKSSFTVPRKVLSGSRITS